MTEVQLLQSIPVLGALIWMWLNGMCQIYVFFMTLFASFGSGWLTTWSNAQAQCYDWFDGFL